MSRISLYEIKEKAINSGRMVYSPQQLSNLIVRPKTHSWVYFSRLIKSKLADKLTRGKISFTDDLFIISTQLVEPSYISLNSALSFHKLCRQVPKYIECITTKKTLKYPKLNIMYHKIVPSFFYGFNKYKKGSSYVYIAEPEKALLDGIYLNIFTKDDYKELKEKLNYEKLVDFASRFKGRGNKKIMKMIK